MSQYTGLAGCYDAFTTDVDYPAWADYYVTLFRRHTTTVESLLDLACGTGSLSLLFAERGFEVIGVDASVEMLAAAQSKAYALSENRPMFLCQTMEELDLYGTVDAAISSLDSINYLNGLEALDTALGRLQFFVRPGGLFIFDVNTEAKFRAIDGESFVREEDDTFCVWSAAYDAPYCAMTMDLFTRAGKLWSREREEHLEYAFSDEMLKSALMRNQFEVEAVYAELSELTATVESQRVFYVARRRENQ